MERAFDTALAATSWLLDEVRSILGADVSESAQDVPLNLLGLDSIGVADLVQRVEIRFGNILTFEEIPPDVSVADLAAFLTRGSDNGAAGGDGAAAAARSGDPVVRIRSAIEWPETRDLLERRTTLLTEGLGDPYFRVHDGVASATTRIDGREVLNFSTYDYLALNGHPRVSAAAQEAIARYGTSVSASRPVSGERPVHAELETRLAEFAGTEAALTFVSGNLTNVTILGHVAGPADLILHDALAHSSIVQGALLSRARRRIFPHNDWRRLDQFLAATRDRFRRVVVAIEGLYSMDGDLPDVPRFVEVVRRHDAILMVDEAHSLGVVGATGRGVAEHFDLDPADVEIWMGTLSKSLASCGGYIAGSSALIDYLKFTAPGFVYSVGLPPPSAAAALASLEILREEPDRVLRLRARSQRFLRRAIERGLDTGLSHGAAVIPVMVGRSQDAFRLSERLLDAGINVQPIVAPAVEEGRARLRFFISTAHTDEQVDRAVDAVAAALRELSPGDERAVAGNAR